MIASDEDWKLYRSRVPKWQEAYMAGLLTEYEKIIQSEEQPSERFWALEKRISKDRQCPGVLIRMSRSHMLEGLIALMRDHVITPADLEGFSEETVKNVKGFPDL